MGRKWYWMSGYSTPAFDRMKAQASNWFDAPGPFPVNSHCAPTQALPQRFQYL